MRFSTPLPALSTRGDKAVDKFDLSTGTALVGAAIFQVHSQYTSHAGSLSDTRQAAPGDMSARQRVLDADVLTGGLVLLVGGSLTVLTRSATPFIVAAAGFLLISMYYHAALVSPGVAVPSPVSDGEE